MPEANDVIKLNGRTHTPPIRPLDDIKMAIAVGEWVAGDRLKPESLKERYGLSASAIRELLLRLSGEGLVSLIEQRGFRVPEAKLDTLRELLQLRILIESEGARLSILNGDLEWEAQLNAAHHKLAHIESRMLDNQDNDGLLKLWTDADNNFHRTLLSACGSQSLAALRDNLFFRLRQQVIGCVAEFGFRGGTVDEHATILDAALARDAERCSEAIALHLKHYLSTLVVDDGNT